MHDGDAELRQSEVDEDDEVRASVYKMQADNLMKMGHYSDALVVLTKAIALEPLNSSLFANR